MPHVDHQGVWVSTTGFQELAEEGRGEGYAAAAAPGAPERRKGQEPRHRRPTRGDRGERRGGAHRGTASGHLAPDAPRGPALWTRRLSRGAQLAGRARGRGAGQRGEVVQNLSLRREPERQEEMRVEEGMAKLDEGWTFPLFFWWEASKS